MKKLWRFSHLSLAILSFLFLTIAGLTGAILAVEPMQEAYASNYITYDLEEFSLGDIIVMLRDEYDEVFDVEIDENQQIVVNLLHFEPALDGAYVLNPLTGQVEPLQEMERARIYEWSQSLHRSLFLESTGRNIMAIMALILCLIVISGIGLIAQRQHGWKRFYKKIVSSHYAQFSHVWLGRIFLFPLLIVTFSALVMAVDRLGWMVSDDGENATYPWQKASTNEVDNVDIAKIEILRDKTLADIHKIEFPFSTEPDDYYTIYFKDSTIQLAQGTGEILSKQKVDVISQWLPLATLLHTGKGNWLWAIILFFSAISVLYFIYSGAKIFLKRKIKKKIKNVYKAEDSEYIILYGSETDATKSKAFAFYNALIENDYKAWIHDMNHVQVFPAMKHLVIFTSTYCNGEPPMNAEKFMEEVDACLNNQTYHYSLVGFGSKEYPHFCQFAKDCQKAMAKTSGVMLVKPYYINHQDPKIFQSWWHIWMRKTKLGIELEENQLTPPIERFLFKVVDKKVIDDGHGIALNLWLNAPKMINFDSGDLLAVFAPNTREERYYSLSKIHDKILISIRLHPNGVCSSYLYEVQIGDNINGYIKPQPDFHYNPEASSHIYIANGTGIAPFIGMIENNQSKKQQVILGLKNKESFKLYQDLIEHLPNAQVDICYSREGENPMYLQEVVKKQSQSMIDELLAGGEILICGNLAIGKDVLHILNTAMQKQNLNLEDFEAKHQIKMDCY